MTDEQTAITAQESGQDARRPLSFEEASGARRSTWVAAALLLAIVGWMGSGFVLPSETPQETQEADAAEPVSVAVRLSQAKSVTLYFQAEGQAQPDRDTLIRAEISGDVSEVPARRGDDVTAGQVLARLSTESDQADLRRAQEELDRAQREFDNASELRDRGVATVDRVAQARATLAAARAQVTDAEQRLEAAVVTAPFDGRIERLSLDVGEYVQAGTDVGRIVDNRPLAVAIQVPQQTLGRIRNGQKAEVRFITGETRSGAVTFVGTAAAAETRTFLAEIEVANADGAIPAGISAEVRIPTGQEVAHFVSPSIVSLDADGTTGVKAVEDGRVVFHDIQVARAEVDGIWVTGLPQEVRIITIGQGFVAEGEQVNARPETAPEPAADAAPGSVADTGQRP